MSIPELLRPSHRPGQPVFVHKFVVGSSIAERIEVLKTRSRDLERGLLDPDAGSFAP